MDNGAYYNQEAGGLYDAYPQQGYPQPGMPQPGMPQPGMPQPGMPQPGMPQQGYNGNQLLVADGDPIYTGKVKGKEETSSSSSMDVKKQVAIANAVRESNFLRKVYIILTGQILLTMILCIVAVVVKVDDESNFEDWDDRTLGAKMAEQAWVYIVSIILILVGLITCLFVYDKVPANFIFLGCYTVGFSLLLMAICGVIGEGGVVAAAFIITAVIFIGLTILTFIPGVRQAIFVFVLFALLFCIIGAVVAYFVWFTLAMSDYGDSNDGYGAYVIYCAICAAIMSCYIVIDSMWAREIDAKFNNYIYAATRIYVDVIYLLILILSILGGSK